MEHAEETTAQEATLTQSQVISTKDWIITLLISFIPVVNLIMFFVWAFGNGTPESKSNWAKATLIWLAIFIALYLLLFIIAGASIMTMSN